MKNPNDIQFVYHLVRSHASSNPTKIAIIQNNTGVDYKTLNEKINRFANFLISLGGIIGDRVIIKGDNTIEFVIAIFGTMKAGMIAVPIHPQTPNNKMEFIIGNCSAKFVVTDEEYFQEIDGLKGIIFLSGCNNYRKTNLRYSWEQTMMANELNVDICLSPQSIAVIIYTSGSTGAPKGVIEPHENILFAVSAINNVLKNDEADTILCGLPLSFDYGLYQLFLGFAVGATIVLEKNFNNPIAIPKLLYEYSVTGLPLTPSLIAMLLSTRLLERIILPKLKYITSTGDVFPSAHIKRLQELLPNAIIYPMYGLTECKRVSIMPKDELYGHEDSVGKPLPGTNAYVVNVNNEKLGVGNIGELVVEGPHVMAGYWADESETRKRFITDNQTGKVLLYTKDIFKIDNDGFLYYLGRDELLIKCRGHRVSAAEVETIIAKISGVREVGVVGVDWPIIGQEIFAFVSCDNTDKITSESIQQHCSNYLLYEVCPKYIISVETMLPRTENGKLNRKLLKELIQNVVSRNKEKDLLHKEILNNFISNHG